MKKTFTCKKCKNLFTYSKKRDAYFCKFCDRWEEIDCLDESCQFCKNRPEKPSQDKEK
jgi:primosomal protein N'